MLQKLDEELDTGDGLIKITQRSEDGSQATAIIGVLQSLSSSPVWLRSSQRCTCMQAQGQRQVCVSKAPGRGFVHDLWTAPSKLRHLRWSSAADSLSDAGCVQDWVRPAAVQGMIKAHSSALMYIRAVM